MTPPRTLLLAITLICLSACATWEGLSPTTQAVLKAGAKLALSYGVQELGDRVHELRPYQGKLNTLLETTFAKPIPAEELGAALKRGVVAVVPAELRPAVLAQFKDSLSGNKTTAASPGNVSYNAKIAAIL